jgi:hypothetical protein
MSDEELKLNRRLFLQQTAVATATAGACYTIAMKTDAIAQQQQNAPGVRELGGENIILPYLYSQP